MAAACSPPWNRIGDSPDGDSTGSPSGSKLEPTDATPERPSSRNTGSPEDSCAICLGAPENKSFTDSCFHQFCFACLAEWAKVKAECPLCKQRFKSIIHSVRSLEDYDQYFVSDLQRAPAYSVQVVIERRFRFSTTMTAERRQELEAMRQRQERERQTRHTSATRRNQNRYLPRGATTSADRFQLYLLDLWAVPSLSQYREASPEFYRENPACTHRLVPWLNRELNALMQPNRSHIVATMDNIMSLILNLDIRHPDFARHVEPYLRHHTEHFVHEFFLFATSVHDMAAYDQHTAYTLRSQACAQADPVTWFRRSLRDSERAAALESLAAPVAERHDSPQPGPSGLAATREVVVATTVDSDSDSDSSDCVVVKVVKPGERTVVIDLVSSDEDDASARGSRQADPCDRDARPSHSSRPLEDRKPVERHAASDSSSSDADDEYPPRRHSQGHAREHSKPARDRRRTPDSRGSSSRSRQRQQKYVRHAADTGRGSNSQSSTTSDDDSQHSVRRRKLVSVVGAVNIASKSRDALHHERHHSHHHRHEHRSRKKSTKKHKHKRHSSSRDF